MYFIVTCGGTGGHMFPGLAVAKELLARGHRVVVWSSGRDIESSVMKGWEGEVFSTGAKPLKLSNAFAILRSILKCSRQMRKSLPDALLAMGSYSSLPPVLAAARQGVPIVLHEANAVPGKAVDWLSRFAKAVAVSFRRASDYFTDVETEYTGLPVRESISKGKRFDFIPEGSFTIFVTGGSQGAVAINHLASEALVLLQRELVKRAEPHRPLYVIHQTGPRDEGQIMALYAREGIPARVQVFEREMSDAMASADFVLARAGASTCFELAACGKPALLIPLPTALRDHQHFNAEEFAAQGAADEGDQNKLTANSLFKYLLDKYDHPERLVKMSERMLKAAIPGAASKVADLVERATAKMV